MIRVGRYLLSESVEKILYDVKSSLTNGKLKDITRKSGEICITCPCHDSGKEATASCYVTEDGVFHCFACGAKGNFSKLIGECFDADANFGKKWLVQNYIGDVLIEHSENIFPEDFLQESEEKSYLDESCLDEFDEWHEYLERRHLSKDVCKRFKVRYDRKTSSIVFPVWNEHNKLCFLTRRSVLNKRFNIPSSVEKPIYLLNFVIKSKVNYSIICESQINALYCQSLGLSAVATFGCNFTDKQLNILKKSGIRYFIIGYDGDEAGRESAKKLSRELSRYGIFVDILHLPDGKDLNDLSLDEIKYLLKNINTSYEELKELYESKIKNID